ncbi:hypothetical protein F5887DRAFT_621719 [Amanita rubescens]|nr:hypothetical protein F5887DRAFT_621719 [Amanita rubescens]
MLPELMPSSGTTAQDGAWKEMERSEEARYAHAREQEQLAAIKKQMDAAGASDSDERYSGTDKDFEGGYGGQEDLEDRYATTSGEH